MNQRVKSLDNIKERQSKKLTYQEKNDFINHVIEIKIDYFGHKTHWDKYHKDITKKFKSVSRIIEQRKVRSATQAKELADKRIELLISL